MSVTLIDPVTALIVVDLQKGFADHPFFPPLSGVIARTRELLHAFRAAGMPVVLVNVAGRAPGRTEQGARSNMRFAEGWTDLLPELDRQPEDIAVTKRNWGAFGTTELQHLMQERGVTQVVVCGVATSGGVEATARQAYELGFNVTLPLDAVADIREESHNYVVGNVFPRVGETGSSKEVIATLNGKKA